MNLCIVSTSAPAGGETFVRQHVERLAGDRIVLHGEQLPLQTEDGEALVPARTFAQKVACRLRLRFTAATWTELAEERVAEFLRDRGVQVVLAEYGMSGVLMAEICERAGVPLVVHFHGYDAYDRSVLEGDGQQYRSMFERAAAVVCVSRHMGRQLGELGAPPEKLRYNPYGVDPDLFHGASPATVEPTFVAVGRFVEKKAPQLTILAFERCLREIPSAKLIMAGGGGLHKGCCELVDALRIRESVTFVGPQPPDRIAALMRIGRAFVQHSRTAMSGDSEGTPVAVIEAGASGLPVVATRHAGIPDVVVEGDTGLLVDEGDVGGMADAMLRIARDGELAGRMGQRARERVLREFNRNDRIATLRGILEQAGGCSLAPPGAAARSGPARPPVGPHVGRPPKLVMGLTTFNRAAYLKRCLESWDRTRSREYDWVLIVADDGSDDGTREYLESLAPEGVACQVLHHERRGVHHQVNRILKICEEMEFDYGFRCEDDVVFLSPGWDRAYLDAIWKTGYDHLCFRDNAWGDKRGTGTPARRDATGLLECATIPLDVQGAFWTFTRRMIREVGYLDLAAFGLSDLGHTDYTYRCCRAGFNELEHPFDMAGSNTFLELRGNRHSAPARTRYDWNTPDVLRRKTELLSTPRGYVAYNEAPVDMEFRAVRDCHGSPAADADLAAWRRIATIPRERRDLHRQP